ncbi:acyl-CoA synthetase [Acinetobacter pragensis]|uniref:Acyl-CoA synthetase n=1 Tax=Acinetobacter pragensis TaxID=1806892 RepID=A0A151Y412_9GAMM|nr:acyl-CoA synthetase [Acinetobacter pragensis]KYQ72771.1 acyl-CoA synthetase [Acinetobacter pragensis]
MNGISSLADVERIELQGMPKDFPSNTYALIRHGAQINPKSPALSFFLESSRFKNPSVYCYRELLEQIHQCANFFHALGASKDTVIAYILPNLPETHFVIWGGQATGIIAAINPLLEADAMADILNAVQAEILVTLAPFPDTDLWEKVHTILPRLSFLKHLVLVNPARHMPYPKKIAASLLQKKKITQLHGLKGIAGAIPCHISLHDYHASVQGFAKNQLNSQRIFSSNDYSSFFCTGGTTGLPKVAKRTHANETSSAWSVAQFYGDDFSANKTIFCGLPLFHVNAVLVTGLIPFSKGSHVVLGTAQGYRGEGIIQIFWKIVEHYKINYFSGVPTLYASLLQVPVADAKINSLEYGLCGAAPLPSEIMKNFQNLTGLRILEGYGLTEGTCVSSVNPPFAEPIHGSIGIRIPLQKMKAVILDDQGQYLRDAENNEIGAIAISGPNVFAGYLISEQNRKIWLNIDNDTSWFNTGDLGYQNAQGYFYLTGRKKELIIRGGHNIDPLTIEEPMLKHPAVELAAAVGRPDAYAGELPVLYVQLKANQTLSKDELISFAEQHIHERAAVPKFIEIIDEIPLTPIGKIFKVPLKHQQIQISLSQSLEQANIAFQNFSIIEDKSKGIVIHLHVKDMETQQAALQTLGQFPFTAEIQIGNT